MIHAKDLMVGDWVNLAPGDNNNNINPVQVVAIDYDKEISEDYVIDIVFPITGLVQFNYSQRSLKPIPLTPEILEKNGFYKDELTRRTSQWMLNDDYYDVIVYEVSDSIWCIEYDNTEAHLPTCRNLVCFVHELQHCLKLVGIDKEVEL